MRVSCLTAGSLGKGVRVLNWASRPVSLEIMGYVGSMNILIYYCHGFGVGYFLFFA